MNVTVVGQRELRDLARDLRRQEDGRQRMGQLRKDLRAAAQPLVPAIKANIRSMPSNGQNRVRGRRSLRASMASSVTLQVRASSARTAGVSVFMNPRKMPDKKKSMPLYFEKTTGHVILRHRLFGNREHWYFQYTPSAGYFTRSLGDVGQRAANAVQQTIERTAREIEH